MAEPAAKRRLEELGDEAEAAVRGADASPELEDLRVRYLGRKSELTATLRSIRELPPEARGPVGQAANSVRVRLEELIAERGAALGDQLLQPHAHRVGGLPDGAARLGRQLADRAQRRRQLGLPPEVADAQILELRTRVGAPHRGLRLVAQLLEAALGGGLSHERPS